jgi:hypothetical protein
MLQRKPGPPLPSLTGGGKEGKGGEEEDRTAISEAYAIGWKKGGWLGTATGMPTTEGTSSAQEHRAQRQADKEMLPEVDRQVATTTNVHPARNHRCV